MKTIVDLPAISSDQFTVNKAIKLLSAEASDLQHFYLGRVYPDACDQGFRLVNAKTGNATDWVLTNTDIDAEGDARAWIFVPIRRSVRDNPAMFGWEIHIYND